MRPQWVDKVVGAVKCERRKDRRRFELNVDGWVQTKGEGWSGSVDQAVEDKTHWFSGNRTSIDVWR